MAHKFEIYKDKAGEYRVRFKYNSEVIFSTEGYSSKSSAQNAIDSIKKNGQLRRSTTRANNRRLHTMLRQFLSWSILASERALARH